MGWKLVSLDGRGRRASPRVPMFVGRRDVVLIGVDVPQGVVVGDYVRRAVLRLRGAHGGEERELPLRTTGVRAWARLDSAELAVGLYELRLSAAPETGEPGEAFHLTVNPEPNGVPLEGISLQTVLTHCLGPLSGWERRFEAQRGCYNMYHFTPMNAFSASGSCYSLLSWDRWSEEILGPAPPGEGLRTPEALRRVGAFFTRVLRPSGVGTMYDVVLNHLAPESPLFGEHPESSYCASQLPYLLPAVLLDLHLRAAEVALKLGRAVRNPKTGGLIGALSIAPLSGYFGGGPGAQGVRAAFMAGLWEFVNGLLDSLRLWEYETVSVEASLARHGDILCATPKSESMDTQSTEGLPGHRRRVSNTMQLFRAGAGREEEAALGRLPALTRDYAAITTVTGVRNRAVVDVPELLKRLEFHHYDDERVRRILDAACSQINARVSEVWEEDRREICRALMEGTEYRLFRNFEFESALMNSAPDERFEALRGYDIFLHNFQPFRIVGSGEIPARGEGGSALGAGPGSALASGPWGGLWGPQAEGFTPRPGDALTEGFGCGSEAGAQGGPQGASSALLAPSSASPAREPAPNLWAESEGLRGELARRAAEGASGEPPGSSGNLFLLLEAELASEVASAEGYSAALPILRRVEAGEVDCLACNGWVMGKAYDFTTRASRAYLRRQVISWGDCAKLRYFFGEERNAGLFALAGAYARAVAGTFDAIRVDNAHATDQRLLSYFIGECRAQNPELLVMLECFYGSDVETAEFTQRVGGNAFVKEMCRISGNNDASAIVTAGAYPIGDTAAVDGGGLLPAGAFLEPWKTPCVYYSFTHDNDPPGSHPSPHARQNFLPITALACASCMGACATTKGLDDGWAGHISVLSRSFYPLPGPGRPAPEGSYRAMAAIREVKERLAAGYTQVYAHTHANGVLTVERFNPSTGASIVFVIRTAFKHQYHGGQDDEESCWREYVEAVVTPALSAATSPPAASPASPASPGILGFKSGGSGEAGPGDSAGSPGCASEPERAREAGAAPRAPAPSAPAGPLRAVLSSPSQSVFKRLHMETLITIPGRFRRVLLHALSNTDSLQQMFDRVFQPPAEASELYPLTDPISLLAVDPSLLVLGENGAPPGSALPGSGLRPLHAGGEVSFDVVLPPHLLPRGAVLVLEKEAPGYAEAMAPSGAALEAVSEALERLSPMQEKYFFSMTASEEAELCRRCGLDTAGPYVFENERGRTVPTLCGWDGVLDALASASIDGPVAHNLRQGRWLLDYVPARLERGVGGPGWGDAGALPALAAALRRVLDPIKAVAGPLRPIVAKAVFLRLDAAINRGIVRKVGGKLHSGIQVEGRHGAPGGQPGEADAGAGTDADTGADADAGAGTPDADLWDVYCKLYRASLLFLGDGASHSNVDAALLRAVYFRALEETGGGKGSSEACAGAHSGTGSGGPVPSDSAPGSSAPALPALLASPYSSYSLCAGYPHFFEGLYRTWGRDLSMSITGCLTRIPARRPIARHILLSTACLLRHGLLPNLQDSGRRPRYNCRDAFWYWLCALRDYVEAAGDWDLLEDTVVRLFPEDDPSAYEWREGEPGSGSPGAAGEAPVVGYVLRPGHAAWGRVLQPLRSVVSEALDRHLEGISFREWNAGPEIDAHMRPEGFLVEAFVDPASGLVYGGSPANCGTWMDKMGSHQLNAGRPGSSRHGADVEINMCALAGLEFLLRARASHGVGLPAESAARYEAWAARLRQTLQGDAFRMALRDDSSVLSPAELSSDGMRCYLRDVVSSPAVLGGAGEPRPEGLRPAALEPQDTRFRCNYLIGLSYAPPDLASRCLREVRDGLASLHLEGQGGGPCAPSLVGARTLYQGDPAFVAWYDNGCQEGEGTAGGLSYHMGPAWVHPFARGLLALLRGLGSPPAARRGEVGAYLANVYKYLSLGRGNLDGGVRSLPELQQAWGADCPGSCTSQAWAVGGMLEVATGLLGRPPV